MAEPMAVLYSRYSIAMAEEIEIEIEQELEKDLYRRDRQDFELTNNNRRP